MRSSHHCDRCHEKPAQRGIKYCKDCRDAVVSELSDAGYLTAQPPSTQWLTRWRGSDARENTHETKFGID